MLSRKTSAAKVKTSKDYCILTDGKESAWI